MKHRAWYMIAPLVAVGLLATAPTLSAQDWKGSGRIAGKVVDDHGKPVANAVVKLRLVQAGNTGPDVKTDSKGEFSSLTLRGGTWNLDVEAPGYVAQKLSVQLPAGEGRVPPVTVTLKADVAGAQQKELQGVLAKGDELYKAGKFAEARAEYEKVLAARPDLVMVHRSIALTYGRQEDYANALKELDIVLAKDPGDPALLQLAMDAALKTGDPARAAQYLSQIDMAKVTDPTPIVNLAIDALNKNQPKIAVQALDPLAAKFPQDPDAYYYRALAELQLQQMDKAKADLEKVLPLADPGSKEAEQAKSLLAQLKPGGVASRSLAVPRTAQGRPAVNTDGAARSEDATSAAPAYRLRR